MHQRGGNAVQTQQQLDVIAKEFWCDNKRFSDLFNAVIFHGRQVLKPEELEELDTDVSGSILLRNKKQETIRRARDVIKRSSQGMTFAILAVENQTNIHYTMPLRHMIYDGMGYLKESKALWKRSLKKGYNS